VAGAAGLRVFWAWIAPGRQTRLQSLAYWGRQLILAGIGLVGVLLVSGLVEGFVTPSGLPTWAKITIGALVLAGCWTYSRVFGRRVVRAGLDADHGDYDGGRQAITS